MIPIRHDTLYLTFDATKTYGKNAMPPENLIERAISVFEERMSVSPNHIVIPNRMAENLNISADREYAGIAMSITPEGSSQSVLYVGRTTTDIPERIFS